MAEPNALPLIEAWIYYQLSQDAETLTVVGDNIHVGVVPPDVEPPYVQASFYGGQYKRGVGEVRVMTVVDYIVKLVTRGAPSGEHLVALDRFDEVIGRQSDALLNNYRFSGRGERPVSYEETRPGGTEVYYHRGGIFRLWCYPQVDSQ